MSYQKTEYYRDKDLLRLAEGEPCLLMVATNCLGGEGSTTVACHSNLLIHGKGRSIKADDNLCASLCHACHMALDQGSKLSKSERIEMWTQAHKRTVRLLVSRGEWPMDVPIPDIRVLG